MARGALGFEVRFAGLGIADQDAGGTVARRVVAADAEAVQEGRDVGDLRGGHVELRHAGTAVRTTCPINSPFWSFNTTSERIRLGPPSPPPRASCP